MKLRIFNPLPSGAVTLNFAQLIAQLKVNLKPEKTSTARRALRDALIGSTLKRIRIDEYCW